MKYSKKQIDISIAEIFFYCPEKKIHQLPDGFLLKISTYSFQPISLSGVIGNARIRLPVAW